MQFDRLIGEMFTRGKKCIVNADVDGLIAGMLLQNFLNWNVVGYSSCCGKPDDDLWLKNTDENLQDCVFVDLPVSVPSFSVIDQHFVLFNEESRNDYLATQNKINPNVMRGKVFRTAGGSREYTGKYPFGTAHFVLTALERLGVIDGRFSFDFSEKFGGFDLADLLFRADRVIGNMANYTPNCLDWADWLIELGGHNTAALFHLAKSEYGKRLASEAQVGNTLRSFGCKGADGDCSNLFREKNDAALNHYFAFLGRALGLPPLPVFPYSAHGGLWGQGINLMGDYDLPAAEQETKREDIFSFAFVSSRRISLTYFR